MLEKKQKISFAWHARKTAASDVGAGEEHTDGEAASNE